MGRSGLRESPQPADVSKVAAGDRAKTAAPPPELPGKENLKDILGRPVGEGSQPSVKKQSGYSEQVKPACVGAVWMTGGTRKKLKV